jgi:exopolysaccharide production protein ExoZ
MDSNPPRVILPIQYLRGVAALMVVWQHGMEQIAGMLEHFPLRFGVSGVDLFFVISGFIMVITTTGKGVTPIDFIVRRFIRVVPLYWVLTLALVAVLLAAPSLFRTVVLTPAGLIQSLLFIPHFSSGHPGKIWPILVPGWTLNYEMFFYCIFAASLAFTHRLAVLVDTLVLLVAAGYLLGPFAHPAAQTYTNPVLLEFVAGAAIGHFWIQGDLRIPLAASIIAMLIGATLLVLRHVPPLGNFTPMVGAGLLVCGSLNDRLMHWRSGLPLALGDASYSIYLTHLFTFGLYRWVWVKLYPETPELGATAAFMFLALVVCAIVGWLSYRWIEIPLLNWLKSIWRKKADAKFATVPRSL